MRITIFDKKKNKEVYIGAFDKNTKILTRNVSTDHYMVKEKGYGIQEDAFTTLSSLGCEKIHLVTATQTLEYPYEHVLKQPTKDYGHGNQAFVKVADAKIIRKAVPQPSWLRQSKERPK